MKKIPFFRSYLTGQELSHVKKAIESFHWSGDGSFTKKCTNILHSLLKKPVYLVPSGTSALELAIMTLDLQPGDEVILPSYTFPSTANAAVQFGLKPIFIDVREDTLNLDETLIENALTKKTRAILVVHYAGVAAEMESINKIAKKNNLLIIEDAAHGLNAFWNNKPLGTLGDLGTFSFHQTKNFSCGEGGAVALSNKKFQKKIEIHRHKGTNRSQFLLGKVDKYSWIDRGSNFMLSDILAAFLFSQLSSLEKITRQRENIYLKYMNELYPFAEGCFRLPVIPKNCKSNYHFFHIRLENSIIRNHLMTFLRKRGIETTTHFVPLHNSAGGLKFGLTRSKMNITESASECILRLPLFPTLSIEEQSYVIRQIKLFFKS